MIEALLGPALGKAAGAGAARVAGWGARQFLDERRRKKIRALLQSKSREPQLRAIAALSADEQTLLVSYCESPEMENFATSLTRAFLIEGSGKNAEEYFTNLRTEFEHSFTLWMGEDVSPLITSALYEAIRECVLQRTTPLITRSKLAPSVEAEIVATIGSLSAASLRNTELIESISDFNEIRLFENQYKSQVAALHGTMKLPHAGTTKQVPYADLFVEPQVLLRGEKEGEASGGDQPSSVSMDQLLAHTPRIVLLGDPGGGKSTLSRKLMYDIAADNSKLENRVPFYVELRDFASSVRGRSKRTLIEYLEDECKAPYNLEAPKAAIEYLLLNNRAVLILDGLDELLDVSLRRDVVQAVEGFAHRFPMCPMLVTSRRVGYFEAALNDSLFTRIGLGQFSDEQVRSYVEKWFTLDESVEVLRQDQLARSFMVDSQFVQDLRVNPLMLSLMCGIYASENYIPRNRPDVYEKCALLLFERWDKQRGIIPELSFDAHVQSALRALALHIFKSELSVSVGENSKPKEGIQHQELVAFLKNYLRKKRFDNDEDAETAAIEFLDFCKGRAWVLTDIGAETYGFTHRTFLEYFAASQLVRLHTSATDLYKEIGNLLRAGEADVVAQLAVQILGKTAEDGADDFLAMVVNDAIQSKPETAANLISFAARSLSFVVPRPDVLKSICQTSLSHYLDANTEQKHTLEAMDYLFRCSAENAPRIGQVIRDEIMGRYGSGPAPDRAIIILTRHQGAYADRQTFWPNWLTENMSIFKSTIEAVRPSYAWSAVAEFEVGKIDLAELVSLHGVAPLYSFNMGGVAQGAPFVYRFLMFRFKAGYLGFGGMISAARRREISREILTHLPQANQPWLSQEDGHELMFWILDYSGRETKLNRAARTVIALPLLEMILQSKDVPEVPEFQKYLDAREKKTASKGLRAELEDLFDGFPDALDLALGWCQGKITLLEEPSASEGQDIKR